MNVHVDAVSDVMVSDKDGFLSRSLTVEANYMTMKERILNSELGSIESPARLCLSL